MLLTATLKLALPVTFSLLLPLSGLLPRRLLVQRVLAVRVLSQSALIGTAFNGLISNSLFIA